jgi:hypothetical protein
MKTTDSGAKRRKTADGLALRLEADAAEANSLFWGGGGGGGGGGARRGAPTNTPPGGGGM